jgi:hypothetical protein
LGVAPTRKVAATSDKVLAMVAGGARGLAGKRDRALLLLGFALAARRSELVALDVADLEECPDGLRVTIRRSKTDQEAAGAVVAVCRGSIACPVAAVMDWLTAADITAGPVFRPVGRGGRLLPNRLTPQSVAIIVKAYAARLGFDPGAFSGHSLRSGFLTSAAARGASLFKMMDVSRHKSVDRFPASRHSSQTRTVSPSRASFPSQRMLTLPVAPPQTWQGQRIETFVSTNSVTMISRLGSSITCSDLSCMVYSLSCLWKRRFAFVIGDHLSRWGPVLR